MKRALVVLADGAAATTFEELLAADKLPAIQEHVVARGSYRRATSVAPSTTGPAHVPLLCGTYPGTADVPGYRWFDRRTYKRGLPLGPWCLRSYTTEGLSFTKDLAPGTRTIYEQARKPVSVFGVLEKGAGRYFSRPRPAIWLESHYLHNYERADRWARRGLVQAAADDDLDLAFVCFPGIDWNAHYKGFESPEMFKGFEHVDRAIADAAAVLQARGTYEDTLLVVCSDHGHSPIHTHRDLPVMIDRELGIRTAYASLMAFRPRPRIIACLSGNGMAQLHVRNGSGWRHRPQKPDPELVSALIAEEAVDIVIARENGGARITSRRGEATIAETDAGVRYRPTGDDPFGLPAVPETMTPEESLEATFDTEYPDALVQVAQLLRSPRTGDVIVTASPGFDLRERFEWPEHRSSHGALHRAHMLTPLAASAPLHDGPMRTADVAPTVLDWLQAEPLEGIDGRSRLAT